MKRDLLVALAAVLVVSGISYGLTSVRKLEPPQPSPLPEAGAAHGVGAAEEEETAAPGTVVMRVNGEAITESEFALFVQTLPEQMQAFAANPAGRREIANQIVRLKVLEQEARRMGASKDPEVAMKMGFGRTNLYVEYALRKIATTMNDAELRAEYEKEKDNLGVADLSHILVAYQGGAIPPRSGEPPTAEVAMQKANAIAGQLRAGAPFTRVAAQVSDDTQTANNGGALGPVPPGALPPELQEAIDAVKTGEISAPVRSQFGIHIFKVNARRAQPFEQVKPMLQRRAQQTLVTNAIEKLQKAAKVDLEPSFFDGGKPAPRG